MDNVPLSQSQKKFARIDGANLFQTYSKQLTNFKNLCYLYKAK